ncbi:MAG TPA: hypothetical protein VLA37_01055 [Sphingomonadaceae bacterium]|nr:hypothetical protein [Sphingomonadaceae bacterium]
MNRIIRISAIALAGAALYASPAYASDVVGTWNLTAATQMGEFKSSLTVSETDGGYTVEMEDVPPEGGGAAGGPPMEFDSSISDVAVEGNKLTFKRALSNPQFSMVLSYTLDAAGDAISGSANSDFGPTPITGTRAE